MDSGRRTRSGAVFSPWQTQVHAVPLDIRNLLQKASQAHRSQGSQGSLGNVPPAAGNTLEPGPLVETAPELGVGVSCEGNGSSCVEELVSGASLAGDGRVLAASGLEAAVRVGAQVELNTEHPCMDTTKSTRPHQPSARSERNKLYHKAKRQKRREQLLLGSDRPHVKKIAERRVMEAHTHLIENNDLSRIRHANPGYVGARDAETDVTPANKSVDDLIVAGYTYIPWDGVSGLTVVDCKGRGIAYGGSPKDQVAWAEVASNCAEKIQEARDRCSFKRTEEVHRRGDFPALAYGISYGQGQPLPMRLSNSKRNNKSLQSLLDDSSMKRIAGFQGQLFRTFAPKLSDYYDDILTSVEEKHNLKRNFQSSNYASITINFGPRTVSVPHYDTANLAYGLCAITALGDFNPDVSGFIVLKELRLIIRFPPGATLLILSAIVQHYNLPIAKGERRYSVTQYSAGHLFRWVNNGFCVNADRSESAELRSSLEWELGLDKLPVVFPHL